MKKATGFVAYPSSPHQLATCIKEGIAVANSFGGCLLTGWEENDIAGRPLTAPIFEGLQQANILIADITLLNFNVTFEIGYAIGIGRRVVLVRNSEYTSDQEKINRIGIFDTLGYETYANEKDFAKIIQGLKDLKPITVSTAKNNTTPAYILETPAQGYVMTQIKSRVKKARLFYRSFTPTEESRLSAVDAISHVSQSHGVIVPLVGAAMKDHDIHNIRAAFVAGLSLGMEVPTLILQDQEGPLAPLDVRDYVKQYSHPDDIATHIHDFSLSVFEQLQQGSNLSLPFQSILTAMSVGDPMAENEFQSLGNYYLQTDEFSRALRGEVNLVVGRKGTGKTALFSQLRNHKRSQKTNVVVDLKPEGYQLLKLKEEVLDFLSAGSKHHLITAFWEFLLYSEICHKVLEKDAERHLRDHNLYEPYLKLRDYYREGPFVAEGDFSERLLGLSNSIVDTFRAHHGNETGLRLMADEVTGFVHSHNIRAIKNLLTTYLKFKDEVWLLFDNLDKGWSTHGLAKGDITILRCLIDAARNIQRDLSRGGTNFHAVVFVRNDVYQLLMDESPDFGKESRATLDWSDPELLRAMLGKRLLQNNFPPGASFEATWRLVCVTHYKGEETSQFMIDRSLMRPRYLLKLFNACKGFAVNMQHTQINDHDIEKGLHSFSNDLVIDADQELTDIEPTAKRLIYEFVGEGSSFTYQDLVVLVELHEVPASKIDNVIDFLLYYGFLGIKHKDEDVQYIYDVGYNMEIIKTRVSKQKANITYSLHPAFWSALGVSH